MADERRTPLEAKQLAMLAALGIVLLALVYFLFLRGGDSENAPATQAAPPPIAQAETEDPFEADPGDAPASQPVETFEVFASRDPFEPIVDDEEEAENAPQPGADEGDRQTQDPDDGEEGLGEGEIATGAQANQQEVEGRSVELIDVFRERGEGRAQVQVDATGYTVAAGEIFAENFQLVSTSGTCATMLYGDDQFTLCEGEEILK